MARSRGGEKHKFSLFHHARWVWRVWANKPLKSSLSWKKITTVAGGILPNKKAAPNGGLLCFLFNWIRAPDSIGDYLTRDLFSVKGLVKVSEPEALRYCKQSFLFALVLFSCDRDSDTQATEGGGSSITNTRKLMSRYELKCSRLLLNKGICPIKSRINSEIEAYVRASVLCTYVFCILEIPVSRCCTTSAFKKGECHAIAWLKPPAVGVHKFASIFGRRF